MLGQVVYQRDGKGTKVVRAPLHGVPVLRVALDPEGFWARRRAGRAARRLVRQGAARVLVPEDFPFWEELSRADLRPVDPLPLLRSCAAPMALALLRRQGEDPLRAAVALRGTGRSRIWSGRRRSCAPGCGICASPYRRAAGSWNATSTDSTVWPCGRTGPASRRPSASIPGRRRRGRRSSPCLGRKRIWRGWRCRSPA